MNIAVVDAGANLVAFGRMDGAWLGSLDISIKKAKLAGNNVVMTLLHQQFKNLLSNKKEDN